MHLNKYALVPDEWASESSRLMPNPPNQPPPLSRLKSQPSASQTPCEPSTSNLSSPRL